MILLMSPNGDAPLTALLSKLSEEPTDDPQFHWFEKGLPIQRATITGAVTPAGAVTLSTDIASGGADVDISIRVTPDSGAAADVTWLKNGSMLMNEETDEVFLVLNTNESGGASTRVDLRRDIGLKFTTNPAVNGGGASTINHHMVVIGSAFPEGSDIGTIISSVPIAHFNETQISRTPLSLTRTARRTKLRWDKTGPYLEAKREALQIHSVDLEKQLLFSERSVQSSATNMAAPLTITSTGTPLRTSRGMVGWLPQPSDATGFSSTLATPAIHWDIGTANTGVLTELIMDQWLEEVFRFGSSEKLVFAGSTALNVLNQLAKNKMTIQAVPTDRTYGMQFNRYTTPFGDLLLKQHPLMSHNPTWRKDLIVIDLAHLKLRVLDDTTFLKNRQNNGVDASTDEFLTEVGLEVRFSGRTSTAWSGGGSPAIQTGQGPAVHARLRGASSYGG